MEPLNKNDRDYLNNHIEYAIKTLGYRNKAFKVSEETMIELSVNSFDKNSIKLLVSEIMRYLNSPTLNIDVDLRIRNESKYSSIGTAGQYQTSNFSKKITLYLKPDYTYFEVVAIICHECTHDYLLSNGIKIESEKENEVFTDVAAIYLGFERYIQTGYKETRRVKSVLWDPYSVQTEGVKIGYINSAQIEYAIIKINDYRKKYNKEAEKAHKQNQKELKNKEKIIQLQQNRINSITQMFDELHTCFKSNVALFERKNINYNKKFSKKDLSAIQDNFFLHETGELKLKINNIKKSVEKLSNTTSDNDMLSIEKELSALKKKITIWNKLLS